MEKYPFKASRKFNFFESIGNLDVLIKGGDNREEKDFGFS